MSQKEQTSEGRHSACVLLWQATPAQNSRLPIHSISATSELSLYPMLVKVALSSIRRYSRMRRLAERPAPLSEWPRIPYAITLSVPQQPDSDTARVRNLGLRGRNIVFDLEMPDRPYTEITLDLAGQDFFATATVSGTRDPNYANQTRLGDFTLFDLTSQHLSRNTTLHLQETNLPYLHIELAISPATGNRSFIATPEMVQGVTVPPSREAQSIYTTAAKATTITQRGRQSVATFALPERIPIERVSFDLAPTFKANFSRDVRITDRPDGSSSSVSESLAGTILRVHLTRPAGKFARSNSASPPPSAPTCKVRRRRGRRRKWR